MDRLRDTPYPLHGKFHRLPRRHQSVELRRIDILGGNGFQVVVQAIERQTSGWIASQFEMSVSDINDRSAMGANSLSGRPASFRSEASELSAPTSCFA